MKSVYRDLSSREKEILTLLTFEYSTKEIADKLFLSIETIRSHRKNLFKKLQANNLAGLIRISIERNLVDLEEESLNQYSTRKLYAVYTHLGDCKNQIKDAITCDKLRSDY